MRSSDSDWNNYFKNKDVNLRNKLIEENLDIAHTIASKIYQKLDRQVPIEDLKSHSYIGLISATEKYDPTLGYTFFTYASKRIYGAVIDSLRLEGNVSRSKDIDNTPKYRIDSIEEYTYFDEDGNRLEFIDLYSSGDDVVWKEFEEKFIVEVIQELLNSLDKRERDVIYLYFFEHKTDKIIAKELNISLRLIYSIKTRTIATLRNRIYSQYGLCWNDLAA